ncbi:MAG: urea ABC transporter substrate-binding protein [bacterium]
MDQDRRKFIQRTTALGAAGLLPGAMPYLARAADNIKLGSVLDRSGNFDAYGKPMDHAERLAVDEINDSGGLGGRMVEIIAYDTQSDMALYTQYGQQLARRDKVDVVHGGILSASREAIRPTLRKSKIPYFYNVLYEGGVCDRNIFCTGVTPAQQVEVLIPEAIKRWGKSAYILAADYNYGQITAKWVQQYLRENGADAVQTDFFPLDVSDFSATITKIQNAAPDMVISVLVGGAHLSFYRQWAATGMNTRIPMASTTLGAGNEHIVLTPEEGDGILVAYNYAKTGKSSANRAFLQKWESKYGAGSTDSIHEIAVSQYQGIKLWAEAVRQAGGTEQGPLISALESGIQVEGPSGLVTIDPITHHAVLDVHVMELQAQQLTVVESFPQRQPVDTQTVCNLKENPDDNQQYELGT